MDINKQKCIKYINYLIHVLISINDLYYVIPLHCFTINELQYLLDQAYEQSSINKISLVVRLQLERHIDIELNNKIKQFLKDKINNWATIL